MQRRAVKSHVWDRDLSRKTNQNSDLLLQIVDENDMEAALRLIRDIGRYEHVVYHLAYRTNSATDLPYFKSTYPFEWLGNYLRKEYFNIDPIVIQGFDRSEPFFWSDLERQSDLHDAFFKDAFNHGVGRTGFSVPLRDRARRKAMFSVTSNMQDATWRRKIGNERAMLEQIGDILHRKAVRQVYGSDDAPALSPREIECLYWTAMGKDVGTVADIISISEHTVRDYLKSARLKLGCLTIAQAIHEATKLRLISF